MIDARRLGRLQAALSDVGVRAVNPSGGRGYGTLDLVAPRGTCVRLDSAGVVTLFNIQEGTQNQRELIPITTVSLTDRAWPAVAAAAIARVLKSRRPKRPTRAGARDLEASEDVANVASAGDQVVESKIDHQRILDLHGQGWSQKKISDALDIARTTVRRTVEGRQARPDGSLDSYKPEIDPQRIIMVHQRGAAGFPDSAMVTVLRSRFPEALAAQPVQSVTVKRPRTQRRKAQL